MCDASWRVNLMFMWDLINDLSPWYNLHGFHSDMTFMFDLAINIKNQSTFIVDFVFSIKNQSSQLTKHQKIRNLPVTTSVIVLFLIKTVSLALYQECNRQLVGALSPVNHKGLHQGWTQTLIYLQVTHSTSHYTTSLFCSNHSSNSIHNFGTQNQREKKEDKNETHVLEPIYIPWALNRGTCIRQSDLFHSAGLHRNPCEWFSSVRWRLALVPMKTMGSNGTLNALVN